MIVVYLLALIVALAIANERKLFVALRATFSVLDLWSRFVLKFD
jgi:hypothetical protein